MEGIMVDVISACATRANKVKRSGNGKIRFILIIIHEGFEFDFRVGNEKGEFSVLLIFLK
jgi:hypothetical protein